MINIADPQLGPEVEELVISVLRSGRIAQGPMVERFEALCAAMAGTSHSVAVSNGSVALEASLRVLGIGPGDEVITSSLTFAATLNAILASGARARFADIADDYTVDPESVEALIGPATAAIMPVHLYGLPADMNRISQVASAHSLAIVEDAAQAHGAVVSGRPVGSFGLGCFSFYATKNVTSGEGGVVCTADDQLAHALRLLRNQGMSQPYVYEMVGRNLRMTDLQAAVAVPQLERLDRIRRRRSDHAGTLSRLLAQRVPEVKRPFTPAERLHAWHQYTVLLPGWAKRRDVVGRMLEQGVQAGIYYPALVWDHPPYRDQQQVAPDHTPLAADVARLCLSLPVHPGLDEDALERVVDSLRAALL